ncbi:MAG TPA: helix-turn-helix transcriptional regulator [Flavitalea sp.]|nr:helix-turn-helix transcriptional regulator [Flavitalea sp.]
MKSQIPFQYFPGATNDQQQALHLLFAKLDAVPYVFYAIVVQEKGKYKFCYASPSIENLTGHPHAKFSYHEGVSFFFSIIPAEHRMSLLEQEIYHLKKVRQPGFDYSKPFLVEINSALKHQCHHVVKVRLLAIVLEFAKEGGAKFVISTWQLVDDLSENQVLTFRMDLESILNDIYKEYCKTIKLKCNITAADSRPMKLAYPLYESEDATPQEYRVLKLLADGFSSRMIADKLNISFYTAETHRRNLLTKFKAANVAELIKKATKVYWLE